MINSDNLKMFEETIFEEYGIQDWTHEEVEDHDYRVVFIFKIMPTSFKTTKHL